MKSLSLAAGELTVVLAGEPSGISLGPRPDLMRELLPSTFVWLATMSLLSCLACASSACSSGVTTPLPLRTPALAA